MQARRLTEGDREDTEKSSSHRRSTGARFRFTPLLRVRSRPRGAHARTSPRTITSHSHTRMPVRSSRTSEDAWRFSLPRVFQSRGDGLRALWGSASGRDSLLRCLRSHSSGGERGRWECSRFSGRSARCGSARTGGKGDDDGRCHLTRSDRHGAGSPPTSTGVCNGPARASPSADLERERRGHDRFGGKGDDARCRGLP
jgi:hypothetical protein